MAEGTRDPGTGKLTAWGYTERLMRLSQWVVIPLVLWAISVQIFISKGPRWTKQSAEIQAAELREEWRSELAEAIKEGQLPIAAQRLTRLEDDVKEIRADQKNILSTVEGNKSAIQLLLERSDR